MGAPARQAVVGVFANRREAQDAVAHLRRMGFRDEQIGMTSRADAQATAPSASADEPPNLLQTLASLGVPEAEGRFYERQADLGRTLVVVWTPGWWDDVNEIFRTYNCCGGYEPVPGRSEV